MTLRVSDYICPQLLSPTRSRTDHRMTGSLTGRAATVGHRPLFKRARTPALGATWVGGRGRGDRLRTLRGRSSLEVRDVDVYECRAAAEGVSADDASATVRHSRANFPRRGRFAASATPARARGERQEGSVLQAPVVVNGGCSAASDSQKAWSAHRPRRCGVAHGVPTMARHSKVRAGPHRKTVPRAMAPQPGPTIKREPWSEEENQKLLRTYDELGSKWADIARQLPGRTDNACVTKSLFPLE